MSLQVNYKLTCFHRDIIYVIYFELQRLEYIYLTYMESDNIYITSVQHTLYLNFPHCLGIGLTRERDSTPFGK